MAGASPVAPFLTPGCGAVTVHGSSEVGSMAGSHGGDPPTSTRRTVESGETLPGAWGIGAVGASVARTGNSGGGVYLTGGWFWPFLVATGDIGARVGRADDIVDRPVRPGLGWKRGTVTVRVVAAGPAGRACCGPKNSSSGSATMLPWPVLLMACWLRSEASSTSLRSRRLAIVPYKVIGMSSRTSAAAEIAASPVRSRATTEPELGATGGTGRLLGTAPSMAGLACGGDMVAAMATARTASTVP
jgi:hypothetical protein